MIYLLIYVHSICFFIRKLFYSFLRFKVRNDIQQETTGDFQTYVLGHFRYMAISARITEGELKTQKKTFKPNYIDIFLTILTLYFFTILAFLTLAKHGTVYREAKRLSASKTFSKSYTYPFSHRKLKSSSSSKVF